VNLKEVHIGDTRLSGRMFSDHPSLRITTLIASRCPISVHAVRMLAEMCHDSLTVLGLSGCSFLNNKALLYLMKFTKLVSLDLSNCSGLSCDDMSIFRERRSVFKQLQTINVTGLRGMDRNACQDLANALSVDDSSVSVVGGNQDGQSPTVFRGESSLNSCPYSVVEPIARKEAVKAKTDSFKGDTKHRIDLSDDDDTFYSPASPPITKISTTKENTTANTGTEAYMVMPSSAVLAAASFSEEKLTSSSAPGSTSYTNLTHKDMADGKASGKAKTHSVDDSHLTRSRSANPETTTATTTTTDTSSSVPNSNSAVSYSRFTESDLPPNDIPNFPPKNALGMVRAHSEPSHDDSSRTLTRPD